MVIPSYTQAVKTAISLPDELADRIEVATARHGLSRSRFFALAAEHYLATLSSADLGAAIDRAVDLIGPELDEEAVDVRAASLALLRQGDEEW